MIDKCIAAQTAQGDMKPLYPTASSEFEHPEIYLSHALISLEYIAVFSTKNVNLFSTTFSAMNIHIRLDRM